MSDLPRPAQRVREMADDEFDEPKIKGLISDWHFDSEFMHRSLAAIKEPTYLHPHLKDRFGPPTRRAAMLGIIFPSRDSMRLLITKRSNTISFPGSWVLPGGGLEDGESEEHAAVRETEEEVGLSLEGKVKPVHVSHIDIPNTTQMEQPNGQGVRAVDTFFCLLDDEPNFVPWEMEVQAIATPTLEELVTGYKSTTLRMEPNGRIGRVPVFTCDFGRIFPAASDILEHFVLTLVQQAARDASNSLALSFNGLLPTEKVSETIS